MNLKWIGYNETSVVSVMWSVQTCRSQQQIVRVFGFVLGFVTSVLPLLYVPWEKAERKSILQHFVKSPPSTLLHSSAQLSASLFISRHPQRIGSVAGLCLFSNLEQRAAFWAPIVLLKAGAVGEYPSLHINTDKVRIVILGGREKSTWRMLGLPQLTN